MNRACAHTSAESRRNPASMGQLWPLLASAFLLFGFNNTATSALPEYITALGGGAFMAGLQNTVFVLGAVALRFLLGPLADRIGAKKMLIAGAVGFCLPCALFPLCNTVAAVLALRLVQCVGLAAYHPSVSHYITAHSAKDALPRRISLSRFTSTASLMILPAALFPVIGSSGFGPFFALLATVAFVGLLFLLPLPNDRGTDDGKAESEGLSTGPRITGEQAFSQNAESSQLLRQPSNRVGETSVPSPRPPRHLLAAIAMPAVLACGYSVLLVFGPSFISSTMPQVNSGLLLTAVSIGGLAGSLAAPTAVHRLSIRWAAFLASSSLAVGMGVMALGSGSFLMLICGGTVCGFGYFGATTMLNAHVGSSAKPQSTGAAFSAQQSCLDGGMMAGSLLAGALLQTGLPFAAVLLCTALLLAIGAFAWLLLCKGKASKV